MVNLCPKKEVTFFAYTDGFIRDSLHLRKISPNIGAINQKEQLNFQNSQFIILPKVTDSQKNSLLRKLKKIITEQDDEQEQKQKISYDNDPVGLEYDKVSKRASDWTLKFNDGMQQILNEFKDNIDTVDKTQGVKLTFNSIF